MLEKDIWVVWIPDVLFRSPFGNHLVFKGGTSLSKAFGIIRRFSEDIDVTFDMRALLPELSGEEAEPLPMNRSQEKRWTKEIRQRLRLKIGDEIAPVVRAALESYQLATMAELVHDDDKLFIRYEALATGTGCVRPEILLEFGARSTGEPCAIRFVTSDAAIYIPELTFPTASPRTMQPERTFWEKATAMHAYCARGEFRGGNRFSRHWPDFTRLDASGFADTAIAARELAGAVARHKASFFPEKDVDYMHAVSGGASAYPGWERAGESSLRLRTNTGLPIAACRRGDSVP